MRAVFGITGWKNTGKTTLVSALVAELTRRGHTISTIKHAHQSFDIDKPQTDSFSHRAAGAREVAIVSPKRWALMHEIEESSDAPSLETMLSKIAPCDIVLVEGFKASSIDKLECIRKEVAETPIWKSNDSVIALATDCPATQCRLPQFDLNDPALIADYIAKRTGIAR